jgi:8-oxo-dGTP pyrophosphatase MutT (NUDIX family)
VSRIDYFDDPKAPAANSVVSAMNVIVVEDQGRLLMIRRPDTGNWAVPGGAVDLGELVAQAAVRETLEETGIQCEITFYSDPRRVIHYTNDDEVRRSPRLCSSPALQVANRGRVVGLAK